LNRVGSDFSLSRGLAYVRFLPKTDVNANDPWVLSSGSN